VLGYLHLRILRNPRAYIIILYNIVLFCTRTALYSIVTLYSDFTSVLGYLHLRILRNPRALLSPLEPLLFSVGPNRDSAQGQGAKQSTISVSVSVSATGGL